MRTQDRITLSRVFRSALFYGVLTTLVRVGGNVVLVPLLLIRLDPDELALWWVFVALGEISNLADFGFGQAITRAYSYLWAGAGEFGTGPVGQAGHDTPPNRAGIVAVDATVRALYWGLSLVVTALMGLGASFFVSPIVTQSAAQGESSMLLWVIWGGYLVSIAYGLGTSHWMLACQGVNRVRDLHASALWSGLLHLGIASACLYLGVGLASMVVAVMARSILNWILWKRAFLEAMAPVDLVRGHLDPEILRRLWPNSWRFGLLAVGAYLIQNAGILISSRILAPEATADFGLTAQLGRFITSLATLWLVVKWPQLTILRAQGRLDELGLIFARRLGLSLLTLSALAVLLLLGGNRILEWKGAHSRLLPTLPLMVYFLYLAQQTVYVQFAHLKFSENVVPFWFVSLLTGAVMTIALVLMTHWWGVWGLVLAPTLSTLLFSCWYVVWKSFPSQPLSPSAFIRTALGGRP